jgi:CMP-N-acetylneuraminic acid synthetase
MVDRTPRDRIGGAWNAVKLTTARFTESPIDVCLLLPTSPYRDAKHIVEAMAIERDKVASVRLLDGRKVRRQGFQSDGPPYPLNTTLAPVYVSTGGIQIWRGYLGQTDFWDDEYVFPYVIDRPGSLDIDTEEDWVMAQFYEDRLRA